MSEYAFDCLCLYISLANIHSRKYIMKLFLTQLALWNYCFDTYVTTSHGYLTKPRILYVYTLRKSSKIRRRNIRIMLPKKVVFENREHQDLVRLFIVFMLYYQTPHTKPKDILQGMVRVFMDCLLYTSPSPRDLSTSRMPSSA